MLIGYARTSTLEQTAGLDAQLEELGKVGCEKVFQEQVSSIGSRGELQQALEFARESDTVVVTKLDRLARSVTHLGEILSRLDAKKVGLRILNLNLDSTSATGKLMLNVMVSVAQFEREMMLERQREGIAKAKREGKYTGRKATARAKAGEIIKLIESGMGASQVATRLGVGRASVYRVLEAAGHVAGKRSQSETVVMG
jgi:DNA invertase Pin-like site-specific DNA recombinase